MLARAPTTVTNSRWPFTFTRSTANPVSSLWKVMRSINPENPSCGGDGGGVFFVLKPLVHRWFNLDSVPALGFEDLGADVVDAPFRTRRGSFSEPALALR